MTATAMSKNDTVDSQRCIERKELLNHHIRPQQQRILLLHHASQCSSPGNSCSVTQHCGVMKKLWCHVSVCKVTDCDFQHCDTSKRVLTHYSKCTGPSCLVCVPVRKRIKEGNVHERTPDKDITESPTKKQKTAPAESSSTSE